MTPCDLRTRLRLEMSPRKKAQPFGTWKWSPRWRCYWWPLQVISERLLSWSTVFLRWSSMHFVSLRFTFFLRSPIISFPFQTNCDGLWLGSQTVLDYFHTNNESSWAALNAASRAVLKLVPPISWETTECCFLAFWIASKKHESFCFGSLNILNHGFHASCEWKRPCL